ncbi:MAG: HAMP domain-containing histidine kinase [Gammaproteobacteria bacterium]|nr:HAMP domain-containing histidine kinase [Gammaproteobacteria bacterium]
MTRTVFKLPDSLLQVFFPAIETAEVNETRWASLYTLTTFRLFLVLVLVVMFFAADDPGLLGSKQPMMFAWISIAYTFTSIGFSLLRTHVTIPFKQQVYLQVYVDITAIVLLMHTSGGVGTGLEILLLLIVAVTGLLMEGQFVMSCALLSSALVLLEQTYIDFTGSGYSAYSQAGVLCAALFAVAIFTLFLSRHQRASEALAAQKSLALEKASELNRQIVQHMEQGIVLVDDEGTIQLFNQGLMQMMPTPGLVESASLGNTFPELHSALERWKAHLDTSAQLVDIPDTALELRVRFTALPTLGTLLVIEDNAALSQQIQQLKLSSLGRLTASIAHQIRNPLGAISHAGQLLGESKALTDADGRLCQIVLDNARRMNLIVQEILQLTRQSHGQPGKMNLVEELKTFIERFSREQQLESTAFELYSTFHPNVDFDAGHLHQILGNLCLNSLYHNSGEAIQLTFVVALAADDTTVILDIADNGAGIPTGKKHKVFEPFYTTSHTGTGLGLYIARELCHFNGAKLSLLTTRQGTCFRMAFAEKSQEAHE